MNGHFYVIQVAPESAPGRLKLGWTSNVPQRLAAHRCVAPTALLVRSWPSLKEFERPAIERAAIGCQALSREVFGCDDIPSLIGRLDLFFTAPARDEEVAVTFRIPRALWLRVQALAEREHRSRNGQLVALVDEATAQHERFKREGPAR